MEEKNCPECGNEIYMPYAYCNACGWEKKEEEKGKPASKKTSTKKPKKESKEGSKESKEPLKITCKCGTVFKVKSTKRPLKIKCPKCGKTGVLKSTEKPSPTKPVEKKKKIAPETERPERKKGLVDEKRKQREKVKYGVEERKKHRKKEGLRHGKRPLGRERRAGRKDREYREADEGPDECPKCGSRLGVTGTCPNCGFRKKTRRSHGAGIKKRDKKSKHKPPKDARVVKPKKGICSSCGSKNLRFFDDGSGSCPDCGHEFTWDTSGPRIQREEYYCERCNEPLEYIDEYERWYCNNCKEYP